MSEAALQVPHSPVLEASSMSDRDDVVVLSNVTWGDYQRLLEARGERAVPRLAYLEGTLQIIAPSQTHEITTSMLGCLVEAWCMERDVEITPYGSWTLESKESERGVEPDECYVVGDNEDDTDHACPHLAIEVIVHSGGIKKLEIYRKLKVREVWLWKNGTISIHVLEGEQYVPVKASQVLPGIDLAHLLEFVDVRPMTKAVREYRAALRS